MHTSRLFRLAVLSVLVVLGLCGPGQAGITTIGDVEPLYDGKDPWSVSNLVVGDTANGRLYVTAGSGVVADICLVANTPGIEGLIQLAGPNTMLNVGNRLFIGFLGQGRLNANDGAQIGSGWGGIGVMPGSDGTVIVSKAGSRWINRGSVFVGGYGTGALFVEEAGQVNIGQILYVGGFDTEGFGFDVEEIGYGLGTVTVTGSGSLLRAMGIGVGWGGEGTLNILNGGYVSGVGAAVGIEGGTGLVKVDGVGSKLELSSDEVVFDELPDLDGDGDVEVSNGGEVIVQGVGGLLGVSDQLAVGLEGQGSMTVSDGGKVVAGTISIGGYDPYYEELSQYFTDLLEGGEGRVTVTGEGSGVWTGFMGVGFSGEGHLAIMNGGQVHDDMAIVGVFAAGGVDVDEGIWNNGQLVVGAWGDGAVEVRNGGRVWADSAYIGGMLFEVIEEQYDPDYLPTGTGQIDIIGNGSALDVDGTTIVGTFGQGTLRASGGGDITSGDVVIGGGPDATGRVIVEDDSSRLTVGDMILVGAWGTGYLEIYSGGQVSAPEVMIGGFEIQDPEEFDPEMLADFGEPRGTGYVIVKGEGSELEVTGRGTLVVGSGGTGSLEISDGGLVTSPTTFIGGYLRFEQVDNGQEGEVVEFHAGTGAVEVTGEGSLLDTEILVVGTAGDGSLTISGGGLVEDDFGLVGLGPESIGQVTVTGDGSGWNTRGITPVFGPYGTDDDDEPYMGTLIVGGWGRGRLDVLDGGRVDAVTMYIGGFDREVLGGEDTDWGLGEPNGTGVVTVSGEGSSLAIGGGDTLYVGYSGTGTLRVESGGSVVANAVAVGVMQGGSGHVLVDGEDSQLLIEGSDFLVGVRPDISLNGEGYVDISNGGQVKVDGSWLLVADDINVGVEGHGTLEVSGGGYVVAGAVVVGGKDPGYEDLGDYFDPDAELGSGTGKVLVTGSGHDSLGELNGSFETILTADLVAVGFSGAGQMEVTAGGQVYDALGMIGVAPTGDGQVLVADTGSVWTNNMALVVGAWGDGQLSINDGGLVYSPEVFIGGMPFELIGEQYDPDYMPNGTGKVVVSGEGSQLIASGPSSLYVGCFGEGQLDVDKAGQVSSNMMVVGGGPDAIGQVNVTGEGSRVTAYEQLLVGAWGQGQVNIGGGAQALAGLVLIGGFDVAGADLDPDMVADFGQPLGTGYVIVTGEGSELEVTGDRGMLVVGSGGSGTLEVSDGGLVTSPTTFIGGYLTFEQVDNGQEGEVVEFHAGTGAVEVTGQGSLLDTEILVVGTAGDGSLTISGGGLVEDYFGLVGLGPESIGQVMVTGSGSRWTSQAWIGFEPVGEDDDGEDEDMLTGILVVGAWGRGRLDVLDGGRVDAVTMYIGGFDREVLGGEDTDWGLGEPTGTGVVTVSGEGSNLFVGNVGSMSTIFVGYTGQGDLQIQDKAQVESGTAFLGYSPGSSGSVSVSSGATWTYKWSMDVGYEGQGQLVIQDGGYVTGSGNVAYIGHKAGSTGSVEVRGAGSKWSEDGPIYVGYFGTGSMLISDGSQVLSVEGMIARHEGSEGIVTVTGPGSEWQVADALYVGGRSIEPGGNGTLVVSSEGKVYVGGRLVVGPTGRIAGDGQIEAGELVAEGTIAPGSSIGTMHISGDLTFEPNSIYEVEISNDGTSDKLVVVGDVNIVGGTVKAIATDMIVGRRQYQIIQASSVTGEFDFLDTELVPWVTSSGLDYDPNAVWLWLTAMAFNDPYICLTWNQQQIGGALQQIAEQGGNDITEALEGLDDFNDLRDAYDQLCGQIRPSISPILFGVSRLIMGSVSDRFEGASLSGVASLGASRGLGIEGPLTSPDAGRSYNYSRYGRVVAAGNGTQVLGEMPWGIWAKGYGMFGDRDAEAGVWGYKYNTYGVSVGADYRFTESFTAGITVGFAESDVDYFGSADESQIDAISVGLYARHDAGTWYATGLASIGDLTFNTDRYVGLTSEHLTAEFGGNVINAYLEVGAKWRQVCGWQVNPLAALQLSRAQIDGYTEDGGSSALTFDDQQYDSIKSSLGGRMTMDVTPWTGAKGRWELRGRWVHEFADIQSMVEAAFASNPDVVFEVRDAKLPRDSAILGTGLNLQLDRQTRIWVDYDVRLNPDETVHLVSLVGQYRW